MTELLVAEGSWSTTLSLLVEHIDCAVITVLGTTSVMLSKVMLEVVSSVMFTAKQTSKVVLKVVSSVVLTANHMLSILAHHLASLSIASLVAHAFHSILTVGFIHTVASLVVSVLVHEASLITVVTFEMAFIFTTEVLNTTNLMLAIFAHHLVSTVTVVTQAHLISADFTSHVIAASELMSSGLVSQHLMSTTLSVHRGLVTSDSFMSGSLMTSDSFMSGSLVTDKLVSWSFVGRSLEDSCLVLFSGHRCDNVTVGPMRRLVTLLVVIVVFCVGGLLVVLRSHAVVGVSLVVSVASVDVFMVDALVTVSAMVDLRVMHGHLDVIAALVVALSIFVTVVAFVLVAKLVPGSAVSAVGREVVSVVRFLLVVSGVVAFVGAGYGCDECDRIFLHFQCIFLLKLLL